MLPQADWQGAETLSNPGVYTDGYVGSPEYFQFPNRTISKWGFKIYFIMMTNVLPKEKGKKSFQNYSAGKCRWLCPAAQISPQAACHF